MNRNIRDILFILVSLSIGIQMILWIFSSDYHTVKNLGDLIISMFALAMLEYGEKNQI